MDVMNPMDHESGAWPATKSRRAVLLHATAAATTGAGGVLAACAFPGTERGEPASTTQPPVTLELFNAENAETAANVEKVLSVFREKHPLIHLNFSYLANGSPYREKLKVLVTSGTPPDVFYLEWFVFPPYVVQGHLAEIDGPARRDRVGVEDLWPSFRQQFTWRGKLWALGQDMQTMVTWYNVDFFEQAGLPAPKPDWTWDDLLDTARRLTIRQGDQVRRFGVTYWTGLHQPPGAFIYMNGGRLFDRDDDPKGSAFHEPATAEALAWLADLRLKHGVAPTSEEQNARGGNAAAANNIFATGGVAMNMRNVPLDLWQRTMKEYRWSAAPLPKGKAGQFSMSLSHAKVMAKHTKHPEAAWQLLRWLGGKEGQALAARIVGAVPCYRPVAEKEYLPDPGMAGVKRTVLTSLAQGKWFPNTDKVAPALDIINPTLEQMFDGHVPVSAGVLQLRTQVDTLLSGR